MKSSVVSVLVLCVDSRSVVSLDKTQDIGPVLDKGKGVLLKDMEGQGLCAYYRHRLYLLIQ